MSSDEPSPRRLTRPQRRARSSPAMGTSPPDSCRRCSRSPGAAGSSFPSSVLKLSVEDIEDLLRTRMQEANVRVIFTDLQAGSCTMASRRILRGMDDAVLIAGTNLPTLLDFVFAEGRTAPEAARHAAERGRAAITVHGAARDAGAVSHRRPPDSRSGRRRMGTAAGHRFHRARRRQVAASDWEQELYRMGVPPEMDVYFHTADGRDRRDSRSIGPIRGAGILLTGDIATMRRLVDGAGGVDAVNVGGIHSRTGRMQRLRYVFLAPDEEQAAARARGAGCVGHRAGRSGRARRSARRPARGTRAVSDRRA